MQYHLNIKILSNDPKIKEYYENYQLNDDSGVDLIIPDDNMVSIFNTQTIDHKIQCRLDRVYDDTIIQCEDTPYLLMPRSSISKTRFRMANSVGLIDKKYRGNIMAKVDMIPHYNVEKYGTITVFDRKELIKKYSRMFQIVAPDLKPISKINIVESLDSTERGCGGFGSTGL